MKSLILASLLVVAVTASLGNENGLEFQAFKLAHSKTYRNQVEEAQRFAIFKDNLREVEEHNALYEQGLVSYKMGINKFSDMTQEEINAAHKGFYGKPTLNATRYEKTGVAVSPSLDWRTLGQVTEVKDQGQCGACWSFSLTGSLEAAYYRKTGDLVSLSEQQLIDCTLNIYDGGCEGGNLDRNPAYLVKNGLQSEKSYPYKAVDGDCHYDASKVVAKPSLYITLSGHEDVLLEAVYTVGPVSVAIDAHYLQKYHSGIYDDKRCSPSGLDHAVLIVGYGSENGKDYWIVKNSWGSDWGENGYFRILRGTNQCGIAEDAIYPVIV